MRERAAQRAVLPPPRCAARCCAAGVLRAALLFHGRMWGMHRACTLPFQHAAHSPGWLPAPRGCWCSRRPAASEGRRLAVK